MEKLKNLIGRLNNNKFYIISLLLIIGVGTYLRVTCLNKFALTDDETYCYYLAKQSFPFGILNTIFNQDIHAPLYFFILHFWMKLFGDSDIVLRLLSVIFGVLTIPAGYLAGKELLSKKAGLLIAAFISINSLLIYYSQEVKFYSMLPFAVSLIFYFLTRIKNSEGKTSLYDCAGLALSNLILLYTYTFGFIFVFFEALLFLVYFYRAKKDFKLFAYTQLITLGLFLPYLIIFILHNFITYTGALFDVIPWAGGLTASNLIILIQNLFSPALAGLIHSVPTDYFDKLILNPILFTLIFVPVIIYFAGIIKGLTAKNTYITLVFMTGMLFIGVETVLTLAGKFSIVSRYAILSLIPFILTACYGLCIIENKKLKKTLAVAFILINLFYLTFSPDSAQKAPRNGKSRTIAEMLDKYDISNRDIILLPPYGRSVGKYSVNKISNPIYFDILRSGCIEILLGKDTAAKLNKGNSYSILKDYIAYSQPSSSLTEYVKTNIVDKLDKSHYFIIVKDRDIALFDRKQLEYLLYVNPTAYSPIKSKSMFFMLYSKAIDDFINTGYRYFKLVNVDYKGYFEVYVFKKVS